MEKIDKVKLLLILVQQHASVLEVVRKHFESLPQEFKNDLDESIVNIEEELKKQTT